MADSVPEPSFRCEPDPDAPGWQKWCVSDPKQFIGAVMGRLIVRAEGPDVCRMRMFPQAPLHLNSGGIIHGAVTLAVVDVSLFAALYMLRDLNAATAVTLDLSAQFVGAGDASQPLDSVVELLRETRKLVFLRGLAVQGDNTVASFHATVRKSFGTRRA